MPHSHSDFNRAESNETETKDDSVEPHDVWLEVQGSRLNIHVWDNGTVDGDRVTLFLNGERLLYNHYVNKHKMAIPVTLKQDNNFLILHAEDIGSITPNTVAVSVDDGVKEQTIILSSNLDFSGAVMIRRLKVD